MEEEYICLQTFGGWPLFTLCSLSSKGLLGGLNSGWDQRLVHCRTLPLVLCLFLVDIFFLSRGTLSYKPVEFSRCGFFLNENDWDTQMSLFSPTWPFCQRGCSRSFSPWTLRRSRLMSLYTDTGLLENHTSSAVLLIQYALILV